MIQQRDSERAEVSQELPVNRDEASIATDSGNHDNKKPKIVMNEI